MHADTLITLSLATQDGSLPFPHIIGKLLDEGVEYYHVDYAAGTFRFYDATGTVVTAPLIFQDLPQATADFDVAALKAAILDSQQHGQSFRAFCERARCAGVQGYFVFLRGQRVVYMGRQGDMHVEWFAGAGPATT